MKHAHWIGVVGLVAATQAGAADQMKPGQYEYKVKMEMAGAPFAMPEQVFQRCVTQDDVDKGKQYDGQKNKDCETRNMKRDGGKVSFDIACKDGTTGKAEYSSAGDQMTGKTVMNREGQNMTMNMSARRTGDCK